MYTKSVIDKLTEKLAEELSPEQLEELTRLCEGVYQPVTFGMPPNGFLRHVACGGSYAEECHTAHEFSEQDCSEEGRFDWGDCESTPSGPFAGPEPVHPVCSATPPHTYACSADHFSCETETFSCSGSTGNSFTCTKANDETFDCSTNVTCYLEFECEEFDCEAYFGCAETYTCPDEFECKGDQGFTCGEGEQVPDVGFRCNERDHAFGCGYVDAGDVPHGNFECRDIHNCPAYFTCFLNDTCGASPKADSFTCGTEVINPSGYFYCAHLQQCRDTFKCTHSHMCGNGYNDQDTFTCGNGSGVAHSNYDCDHYFTCDDVFNCRDVFHCPDYFTCGDVAFDTFNCGTGDPYDEFSCGDAMPPNYFYCKGQYRCDDANEFGCDIDGEYTCVDEFNCSDASGTFTCGTELQPQHSCHAIFNCGDSQHAVSYSCPAIFTCYDRFMCASPTGATSFTCGADETAMLFTCGTDDVNHADEFGCYSPAKFTCSSIGSDAYHCPGGPNELYNCTQVYTCDNNATYECNNEHPFASCQNPPHECNSGHDAVFRCTSAANFECQTGIEFKCSQLFACRYHHCEDAVFTCGSSNSGTEQFRCDEGYACTQGFTCQGGNGFECQNKAGVEFQCNGAFQCSGTNSHRCSHWFSCKASEGLAFSCLGPYVCPAVDGVFACNSDDSSSLNFECGGTGNFVCNGGESLDFMCAWNGGGGFACTQDGQLVDFSCTTQHVFLCAQSPDGTEFNCGAFTCRPHGICDDVFPYRCAGSEPYSMPGDFGCQKVHHCTVDFKCETPFPGDGFNCPPIGFDCSQPTPFGGCNPAERFSPTSAALEGSFGIIAAPLASPSLRITAESTIQDAILLIQRRSQISEGEARTFLTKTILQNFGITLPSNSRIRLGKIVTDLELLTSKLGYHGMY